MLFVLTQSTNSAKGSLYELRIGTNIRIRIIKTKQQKLFKFTLVYS